MRSKITIHTTKDFKPCIKIVEPHNHHMIDYENDDVRDELVKGFRESLKQSRTVKVEIESGGNAKYSLIPIDDELNYFETEIVIKYFNDSDRRQQLFDIAEFIFKNIGVKCWGTA